MSETMKKPLIALRVIGPLEKKDKIVKFLKSEGCQVEEESDSIPFREALPWLTEDNEPGACLQGARYRLNMTQKQLSKLTGIRSNNISAMETGKRPIGSKSAKKLAEALNVHHKIFLK